MDSQSLRLLLWGLFSLFGFLVFIFLLRNLSKLKSGSSPPSSPSSPSSLCHVIRGMSFSLLQSATDNFSTLSLIRVGHSGEFFMGFIDGAKKVVVKKGGVDTLKKELELYSCFSDRRWLVPLLGYCEEENDDLFLVYGFMEEGDLATVLSGKDRFLPWIARLKIAIEVSEALLFLHCTCTPPILHNDVKSSSILMTANYEVRLGSLSKAMKVEQGGSLSHDIWCFGLLLMDLISGLDISSWEDPSAQEWLQKVMSNTDRAAQLCSIDPTLIVGEDLAKEILGVMSLAKACLSGTGWLTMKLVRQALEEPAYIGDAICMSGKFDSPSHLQPQVEVRQTKRLSLDGMSVSKYEDHFRDKKFDVVESTVSNLEV